jgi:hypothetical protein
MVIPESLRIYANPSTLAMVMMGNFSCFNVDMKILAACEKVIPRSGIDTNAEIRIAVPEADNALNLKICASALSFLSMITLCIPGNSNSIVDQAFYTSLTGFRPHATINNVRKINGDHALTISAIEYVLSI